MRLVARSAAVAVCAMAASTASASAATFEVDDDRAQCPAAPFTSIQAAVDASGPNDTVLVCKGTYEHVVISGPQHAGLRLRGKVIGGATIVGLGTFEDPDGVRVEAGATDVEISRLAFQGPAVGSTVFATSGIHIALEGTSASRIRHNVIRGEFGSAIAVDNLAAAKDISLNRASGYISTGIAANDRTSLVSRNQLDSSNSSQAFAGVYLFADEALVKIRISGNRVVSDGEGAGIYAEGTGVLVPDTGEDVVVKGNVLVGNDIGIRVNDARDILFKGNRATDGRIGIRADATASENVFDHNNALRNSEVDCRDEGPLDNAWIANNGVTSDPPGICTRRR